MNILNLDNLSARKFFLRQESYISFELPAYFNFSTLLEKVSSELNNKELSSYYSTKKPEDFDDVNYKLLNNKDWEYAWRPYQLIHPAIYVSLVHKITEENNRTLIKKIFKNFQTKSQVKCCSIPEVSNTDKLDKEVQILNRREKIEQESICLWLDFDYLFHTDITDCYGSLYTHSIARALHGKETMKKLVNRNNNSLIWNVIDNHLRKMSNWQTNGIPQGSALMDFIAEIVLGYIDVQLTSRISGIPKKSYKILRYRDDYRVFVDNPQRWKEIIKNLTEVLSELWMKINSTKTTFSDNIIQGSIKPDKLYWIENSRQSYKLREKLIILSQLSRRYPNSWTITRELWIILKKLDQRKKIKGKILVMISILIDITLKNPRVYHISSAILSKLISMIPNKMEQKKVFKKIQKKFIIIPNTEHLDLRLQRITLLIDNTIEYKGELCKKVQDQNIVIWNSDWLKGWLKNTISLAKIVDERILSKIKPVIKEKEIKAFFRPYT